MKKILTVFLIALLLATALYAEEAQDKVELEKIIVSASGTEEEVIDYPGNATIITSEDIENSNAQTVYNLLRNEAGIFVKDYTGAGKSVTVDMRGFGETAASNVLVMIDGRRINEIDISGTDWAQIPIELIERIEIIRGSGSVRYGDNATAGVINIITKKGTGDAKVTAAAEFGSYRYKKYTAWFRGGESFMDFSGFVKHERTDGYRLNGDYDGYDYDLNASMHPADYLNLGVSLGHHKDWFGAPGGLQHMEIDQFGRTGSTTPMDGGKTETSYIQVSPEVIFEAGPFKHAFNVEAWNRKRWVHSTMNYVDWMSGALVESMDTSQIHSQGGSAQYTQHLRSDNFKNRFTTGIDVFQAENRLLTSTPEASTPTLNELKINKNTMGAFVTDRVTFLDTLILNAGFRQEWVTYTFDQWEGGSSPAYLKRTPTQEAYDFAAEYKYLERGAIYASFAKSFRFPATDEFYSRWSGLNTNLQHQVSDVWEIGLKDNSLKYLDLAIDFFVIDTKNEIFYDPSSGSFGDDNNYDHTQRKGVEISGKYDLINWLSLFVNYTYTDSYFVGGSFAGNMVPMVPENMLNMGVSVRPIKGVELNFNCDYVGSTYLINDQYNRMPKLKGHTVCNGKISVEHGGIKMFFGINNLFENIYSDIGVTNTSATVVDFYPAPERNYIFGASCEF